MFSTRSIARLTAAVVHTSLRRVYIRALFLLALAAAFASPVAADTRDPILYRIFLLDGSTVVSYGDYTRVGDRIVFSLPLSPLSDPPLHLTSLPASAVDWSSTERYAQSARFQHYRRTRAEADYSALTGEVARALNEIAQAPTADRRLALAEAIRQKVTEWPRLHYGYRVEDVRDIGAIIDAVVADLRAATGAQRFDLNLVALTSPPALVPLLPPPTLQGLIAQALIAARTTDVPAERISLLQSVVSALTSGDLGGVPDAWAAETRSAAARELAAEMAIDRAYLELARTALARATAYAERADVRAVESVVRLIAERDEELGHRRPNEVTAVMTAVKGKLADARHLRLERDRWELRRNAYRRYHRATADPVRNFVESRPWLEDIRALAGPDVTALASLDRLVARSLDDLGRVEAPEELSALHDLLTQSLELARQAAHVRRQAVLAGDITLAWSASSAASGALMLFDRAYADLEALLTPPDER